jgi:hypothetical protein
MLYEDAMLPNIPPELDLLTSPPTTHISSVLLQSGNTIHELAIFRRSLQVIKHLKDQISRFIV